MRQYVAMENSPWMKIYFLPSMGIFQIAMLVYQKFLFDKSDEEPQYIPLYYW